MPEWAQQVIPNVPRIVAVLSLYPACFMVFAWVEDRLSVSVKQEITTWLKTAGDFAANQTLSFNLLRFHSELFGDKQLSVKCLVRTTAVFSFASFFLVFFPYFMIYLLYTPKLPVVTERIKIHEDALTFIEEFYLVSFIFIVLPLDFFGVYVTRKLASLAGNNVNVKKVALIFMLDALTKTFIFPIIFFIFFSLFFVMQLYQDAILNASDIDFRDIITQIRDFNTKYFMSDLRKLYINFVPSLLLCSAWAWLYFVGLRVVRVGVFLFDVDKQPVRSIGIVGAAVLTGCYGLYTMGLGGYAAEGLSRGHLC
jgi:hypothetical protein